MVYTGDANGDKQVPPVPQRAPVPNQPTPREIYLETMLNEAVRLLSLVNFSHLEVKCPQLLELLKEVEGSFKYPFGTFVGTLMNGVPHGKGKVVYEDGNSVTGNVYNDKWEGDAVKEYSSGKIERGFMRNSLWEGYIEVVNPSGQIDKGCMLNNKWHGPSYAIFASNNAHQFSVWNKGDQTGDYMWMDGNQENMRFGQYNKGKCQGEKRIFALTSREFWEDGKCAMAGI